MDRKYKKIILTVFYLVPLVCNEVCGTTKTTIIFAEYLNVKHEVSTSR